MVLCEMQMPSKGMAMNSRKVSYIATRRQLRRRSMVSRCSAGVARRIAPATPALFGRVRVSARTKMSFATTVSNVLRTCD